MTCINNHREYVLTKITPLSMLTTKDLRSLDLAINQAEKSSFDSSLRLGSCLELKGLRVLWGEST